MERFVVWVLIFCFLFAAVFWVYQPQFLRGLRMELVRQYQICRFMLETAGWPALESDHFVVKYRRGNEESARLVLEEAERVYQPLSKFFGYHPEKKVPIAIYTDRASLNRLFGWGSEESAMGVYWAGVLRLLSPKAWLGDIPLQEMKPVFRERGPVAHEYIHLLVDYKTRGNYPRWLTEGLAQFGEERITGAAPFSKGLQPLNVSLDELEKGFDDPASQDYSYGVARGLVIYLVESCGSEAVPRLLEALGRGESLDEAFRQAAGIEFDQFLKGYQRFARGA